MTLYLTLITATVQLLTSVIDRLRFPTIVSLVITALFVVLAVIVLLWSWRVRHNISAITITILVVGAVAVIGSWLGPRSSPDEANTATTPEPSDGAGETTPTSEASNTPPSSNQPSPTPPGNNLCAAPPTEPSTTWFLYEDAGPERRIIVQQDDRDERSIPGSAFSAAGEHVVYADVEDRSRVQLASLTTEQLVGSTTLDEGHVTDTTISQDGETIVLLVDVAGNNRLSRWRPSDNELAVLHDPRATLSSPALSPSANRLAWIEGPTSRLVVADLPSLTQHELVDGARDPAWSPDGTTVVYSAEFGDGRAIYAVPSDGGASWRLTEPVEVIHYDPVVMLSCDGVVYASARQDEVDLWQTVAGGDDMLINDGAGAQSRPAFAGG